MINSRPPITPAAIAAQVVTEPLSLLSLVSFFPASLVAAGNLLLEAEVVLSGLDLVLLPVSCSSLRGGDVESMILSVEGESSTLGLEVVVAVNGCVLSSVSEADVGSSVVAGRVLVVGLLTSSAGVLCLSTSTGGTGGPGDGRATGATTVCPLITVITSVAVRVLGLHMQCQPLLVSHICHKT